MDFNPIFLRFPQSFAVKKYIFFQSWGPCGNGNHIYRTTSCNTEECHLFYRPNNSRWFSSILLDFSSRKYPTSHSKSNPIVRIIQHRKKQGPLVHYFYADHQIYFPIPFTSSQLQPSRSWVFKCLSRYSNAVRVAASTTHMPNIQSLYNQTGPSQGITGCISSVPTPVQSHPPHLLCGDQICMQYSRCDSNVSITTL